MKLGRGRPIALCCACWLLVIGCTGAEQQQTVRGKVSYQGMPLDHGIVSFFGPRGRPISVNIGADGKYQVQLPPGDYAVIVNSPSKLPEGYQEGDPALPPDPDALPSRYSRRTSSGLHAAITLQKKPQVIDFTLP